MVTLGEGEPLGRKALASNLGLGEGATRTVLKKLSTAGYLQTNASGCGLTPAGRRAYQSLRRTLTSPVDIQGSELSMGRFQAALAVRGKSRRVKSGIEQRDSAIKEGALGATTYVISGGKFTIPGGSGDCEKDFPGKIWATLRTLSPRNGDVLILCGSDETSNARVGAIAAALTLL